MLVVSDDPLVRGGLAALLADEPGLVVLGQWPPDAHPFDEADVAVWDAEGGPAALDRMSATQSYGLPVVAVLRDPSQAAVALAAGARAIVSRDVTGARLVAAVRAAAEGMVVLDRAAAASVLPSRQAPGAPVEALTAREQQVLQLLASGLSNKLIAVQLGISEHTAKFHVNSILGKLGAQSRAEAVAQAVRLGMILL